MIDFYIPQTRREILKELLKRWPLDTQRFNKMRKSQLMAIFISLRKAQQ